MGRRARHSRTIGTWLLILLFPSIFIVAGSRLPLFGGTGIVVSLLMLRFLIKETRIG